MAVQHYQFGFRNVELFKEDSLGTGSYGGVCKAKCDGLPCAAKIMHPTLFDLRDPGTVSYLRKFEEECRLLGSARHPNVVQYLGTYRDPDTRLPVLLMELCDESLCRFLERSPRPLPYHVQLNIAHDIVLALVYLHLNSLTHRDLTGNNVLMIGRVRAKVTDFGMAKLASVNPRTTPMTLCPGNVQYMSPEALEEPPSYTDKLDVFSFGVLLVQIMTRQFPNPGPRFQVISVPNYPEGNVRLAVPETQRRSSHLQLIADTHPLKAIAISCLKDQERVRPSAQQLNSTLSELKQVPEYTESLQQAQTGEGREGEAGSLRSQVRDLQQQNHTHQEENERVLREIEHLRGERGAMAAQVQQLGQQLLGQRMLTEAKTREVLQLQRTLQEKERELQEKERDLQEKERDLQEKERDLQEKERDLQTSEQLVVQFQQTLEEKDRAISDLQQTIAAQVQQLGQQLQGQRMLTEAKTREVLQLQRTLQEKERELQEKERDLQEEERDLQTSEQLVAQFQQTLEEKDRAISDLQQTIATHKRKSRQLQGQDRTSARQTQKLSASEKMPKTAAASAAGKDISKLRWEGGKKAPEAMKRGSAVVDGNTVYINQGGSFKIYSCQITSREQQWSTLPDNKYSNSSLVVIDSVLTSVGGSRYPEYTNSLLSLTGGGGRRQWCEVFPAMPTARSCTVSVTTQHTLIVAGGCDGVKNLDIVEVMDTPTKQWSTASRSPHPFGEISGTICGDKLYVAGGFVEVSEHSKSVLTCSVTDLLSPPSLGARLHSLSLANRTGVWRQARGLPVTQSTLLTLSGHLLAIGGRDDSGGDTAAVHCYDTHTDSWRVVSKMKNKRRLCLAAVLPEDCLVVGGVFKDSVEIASLQ